MTAAKSTQRKSLHSRRMPHVYRWIPFSSSFDSYSEEQGICWGETLPGCVSMYTKFVDNPVERMPQGETVGGSKPSVGFGYVEKKTTRVQRLQQTALSRK